MTPSSAGDLFNEIFKGLITKPIKGEETMTDENQKAVKDDIKNAAGKLLGSCANAVNKAFEGKEIPKSEYVETIRVISDCCSQLYFGEGFCKEKPILNITSQGIHLTLNTLDNEIRGLQESIYDDGHHVGKISFERTVIINGDDEEEDEEDDIECTIYFECRDDEAYVDMLKLLKRAANSETAEDEEEDEDDEEDEEENQKEDEDDDEE